MATRSRIAIVNPNGTVESIYCHWDGYPENNGQLLLDNYDYEMARELIDLGDISVLAKHPDSVEAYHRDRGEEYREPRVDKDMDAFFESDIEEYGYLITPDGEWYMKSAYGHSDYMPLGYYFAEEV
jgi:hypothetical protein